MDICTLEYRRTVSVLVVLVAIKSAFWDRNCKMFLVQRVLISAIPKFPTYNKEGSLNKII